METIILVLLMGGMNLLAFLIGARTGQKAQRNETIELPKVNPVEIINDFKERKQEEKEREITKQNWDNINNYRGDGIGQKDIQ